MTQCLAVDHLSIPLVETPMGPLLSTTGGPLEPMAWLVNQAVTGLIPEFDELLERSENVYLMQISATRPEPGDDLESARAQWLEMSGEEPGDDVYLIAVDFLNRPLVVPRRVLRETLARLRDLRERAPKPAAPWLFRADPIWNEPSPGEREGLVDLEEEARGLDLLESLRSDPADVKAAAEVVVKRRNLLFGLEAAGFLVDGFAGARLHWLRQWSLPTLAEYAAATNELQRYLRSRERWEIMPDARPEPLEESRVSLDWFRPSHAPPPGYEPFPWLALCERGLREAPPLAGYSGQVFTRIGDVWYQLDWRRDTGTSPKLVRAGTVSV